MKAKLTRLVLAITLAVPVLVGAAATSPVYGCGNLNAGGCRKAAEPPPVTATDDGFWSEVRTLLHSFGLLY